MPEREGSDEMQENVFLDVQRGEKVLNDLQAKLKKQAQSNGKNEKD